MAKKKQQAVLVADMSTKDAIRLAKKAKIMIAQTGFEIVRLIDIARLHSGFAVIDNDEVVERCFCLADPDHPNVKFMNGEIHWMDEQEISSAASMPEIDISNLVKSAEARDDEIAPLQSRYAIITGKQPDKRWGKDRLLKEIEAAQSGQMELT